MDDHALPALEIINLDGGYLLTLDYHLPVEEGVLCRIYHTATEKLLYTFIAQTDQEAYQSASDYLLKNMGILDGGEEVIDILIDSLLRARADED